MNKKKLLTTIATASALLLVACGNGEGSGDDAGIPEDAAVETFGDGEDVLEVWSFTDEINTMVEDYFTKDNPDLSYKINLVNIPTAEFEAKLDPIINTDAAPDVILLEQNFAKKYVESGLMADLGQFDNVRIGAEDTYEYVKNIGTNQDGVHVANAWQAAPGAFFYRYSLAEKYLGITDPDELQERISDWDGFIEVARELNKESNGEVYMVSSIDDIRFSYLGAREDGWVIDDKLVLDDAIYDMMDTALLMNEEGLMLDAPPETEAYYSGMNNDEIFGYSLPTWGLHFWLKPNGEDTAGDWRMTQGPSTYFRGGTWIGMLESSDMKEEASELITYVTTDHDFLTSWATDTGDIVSNEVVVNEIKDDYSDEYLGGQNHYAQFADMINDIDASIITEYDQQLNILFMDHALIPYSKGEIDMDTAIQSFKDQVINSYPDLIVE